MEDSRKLQVLQNKTLRLRTGSNIYTPTTTLLAQCNELSVNQLTAYHTLLSVHRAVRGGNPKAVSNKLILKRLKDSEIFPLRQTDTIEVKKANLNITRSGFCYRGSVLWNSMPLSLREESKYCKFKRNIKKWIFNSISPKPQ